MKSYIFIEIKIEHLEKEIQLKISFMNKSSYDMENQNSSQKTTNITPKKKRGRPKVHLTPEAKRQANIEACRRYKQRHKEEFKQKREEQKKALELYRTLQEKGVIKV